MSHTFIIDKIPLFNTHCTRIFQVIVIKKFQILLHIFILRQSLHIGFRDNKSLIVRTGQIIKYSFILQYSIHIIQGWLFSPDFLDYNQFKLIIIIFFHQGKARFYPPQQFSNLLDIHFPKRDSQNKIMRNPRFIPEYMGYSTPFPCQNLSLTTVFKIIFCKEIQVIIRFSQAFQNLQVLLVNSKHPVHPIADDS